MEAFLHIISGASVHKCARYWPSKVGSSVNYGEIKVTLENRETIDGPLGLTKRTLLVSSEGNSFKTTQYHMTSWLEHTIPTDTTPLLYMQTILGLFIKTNPYSPVLIHCSSGLGRTGVLITVNEMVFEIERGVKKLDIAKFVFQLLQNRAQMVCHGFGFNLINSDKLPMEINFVSSFTDPECRSIQIYLRLLGQVCWFIWKGNI